MYVKFRVPAAAAADAWPIIDKLGDEVERNLLDNPCANPDQWLEVREDDAGGITLRYVGSRSAFIADGYLAAFRRLEAECGAALIEHRSSVPCILWDESLEEWAGEAPEWALEAQLCRTTAEARRYLREDQYLTVVPAERRAYIARLGDDQLMHVPAVAYMLADELVRRRGGSGVELDRAGYARMVE